MPVRITKADIAAARRIHAATAHNVSASGRTALAMIDIARLASADVLSGVARRIKADAKRDGVPQHELAKANNIAAIASSQRQAVRLADADQSDIVLRRGLHAVRAACGPAKPFSGREHYAVLKAKHHDVAYVEQRDQHGVIISVKSACYAASTDDDAIGLEALARLGDLAPTHEPSAHDVAWRKQQAHQARIARTEAVLDTVARHDAHATRPASRRSKRGGNRGRKPQST